MKNMVSYFFHAATIHFTQKIQLRCIDKAMIKNIPSLNTVKILTVELVKNLKIPNQPVFHLTASLPASLPAGLPACLKTH